MTLPRWAVLPLAAPLLLAGCGGLGEAMTAHTDVVARAAGKELKVEEAAELLATNPQIPADPRWCGSWRSTGSATPSSPPPWPRTPASPP